MNSAGKTIRIVWCLVLALAVSTNVRAETQAIAGTPFGVARITMSLPPETSNTIEQAAGFSVHDPEGRVHYPAFTTGRLGELLGELLGNSRPRSSSSLTISFLFTGQEPLEVTVNAPTPRTLVLTPARPTRRNYNRLLAQWWRDYHASAREQAQQDDFPPLVHSYLTSMLSQRLGLQAPLLSRLRDRGPQSEWKQALELLVGVEKLRDEILRETMSGRGAPETADQPLPPEILWSAPQVVAPEGPVEVEPIAMHVPAECLYIRFGSFTNYRWLSRLMQDFGGDITRMVTLRGRNDRLNERLQYQLALKESVLADVFGSQVIADVAIIGRDLYLQEGATMGVLFQAKSNLGLTTDFQRQRSAALGAERENGATLETVTIAGREVSLLSTPDNRLRSFYAIDGNFHLVATSRTLVQRFFEAGQGSGALGGTREFQHARQTMPLDREDTIFAFFSSTFWAALMSPQYQIELRRRLKAVTDMQLIELSRLAARSEGQAADTIDELARGGFLPRGFGRNVDGSGPILETDRVIDSMRGARGSFKPIADIELRGLTSAETTRYLDQANYFQSNWKAMDPLMVAIKRFALDGNVERITLDANVSPLAEEKYARILSMLGPPATHQITTAPGDIISIQALVNGGLFRPGVPVHHIFLGVQDSAVPIDLDGGGFLQTLRLLREIPGYLGTWPKLGFLDLLPLGLSGTPDVYGFSQLPFGLWRWQGDDFSVLSFQHPVLAQTVPHLTLQETDNPAQIRARVGNLASSQLAGTVNVLTYQRAHQASVGNARLLHTLSQQLGVPRQESRTVAERLLDTELVCALRGEYHLSTGDGVPNWQSTAWSAGPAGYQAPLLEWFRGLRLDLTKVGDQLLLHAEIDMQRRAGEMKLELPLFNLFGKEKE